MTTWLSNLSADGSYKHKCQDCGHSETSSSWKIAADKCPKCGSRTADRFELVCWICGQTSYGDQSDMICLNCGGSTRAVRDTNGKHFWVVWRPNGRQPTVRHKTEPDAVKEAQRIAEVEGDDEVYVLKATHKANVSVRMEQI